MLLGFCAFMLLLIHRGLAVGGYTGDDVNGNMAQRWNQMEVMVAGGLQCSATIRDATAGAVAFQRGDSELKAVGLV